MVTRRHGLTVPEYNEQKPGDPPLTGVTLEPWQERVVKEEKELSERIEKLQQYLAGRPALSVQDLLLLAQQERVMRRYRAILLERMERF